MISNDQELESSLQAIGDMYRAMASLRRDVLPKSRQWFNLMAEGPYDEIRKIQKDIEAYCGMNDVDFPDEDPLESEGSEAPAEPSSVGS